jgi:hypothetical protein
MKLHFGLLLLALAAGAGCMAGPREMPVLQPPALPMSVEESESASGFPEAGAWTSVSLKGPGSAAWRSVDLILHGDGRCLFVGEGEDEVQAFSGRFTSSDGRLTIVRADGRTVRFEWRREGPMLILTEGPSELRMKPIRP